MRSPLHALTAPSRRRVRTRATTTALAAAAVVVAGLAPIGPAAAGPAYPRSTNESTTRLRPALSKSTVSLLPSTSATSP